MDKPTVFIGSSTAALDTAQLVKEELSRVSEPVLWNDNHFFGLGTGTFETLVNSLHKFDFAVLLFTPDDQVIHNGQTVFKPRDNVLIEFGIFTGGLGRDRAFAMRPFHDPLHVPTDLAGVTVAGLEHSTDPQQRYDVKKGCEKITGEIRRKWRRRRWERELGVLYRLVNALTFPHYDDVHVPALRRAPIKYKEPRETFDTVDDVIEFLGEMLTDYVYPQLNLSQLETMRIYFAYYLGDGISHLPDGGDSHVCWDKDNDGQAFTGEFVIGLANPLGTASEQDWRVGRVIKGFSGMLADSLCASVFESGQQKGADDVRKLPQGVSNYKTPGEFSVYTFPVEWRSAAGAGRIGVLTISSRNAHSIDDELKKLVGLLANIIGFLFSAYAVHDYTALEAEGKLMLQRSEPPRGFSRLRGTEEEQRFVAAVIGLRRVVSGYFEKRMIARRRHQLRDGSLYFSEEGR